MQKNISKLKGGLHVKKQLVVKNNEESSLSLADILKYAILTFIIIGVLAFLINLLVKNKGEDEDDDENQTLSTSMSPVVTSISPVVTSMSPNSYFYTTSPPSISQIILGYDPMIFLTIDSFANINTNQTQISRWDFYNNSTLFATSNVLSDTVSNPTPSPRPLPKLIIDANTNDRYLILESTGGNSKYGNWLSFPTLTFNSATNGGFTFIGVVSFYTSILQNFHRIFDFGNGPDLNNIVVSRFQGTQNLCSNYYDDANPGNRGRQQFINNLIRSPAYGIPASQSFDVIAVRIMTDNVYVSSMSGGSSTFVPPNSTYTKGSVTNTNTFNPLANRTLTNNFIGKSNWPNDNLFPLGIKDFLIFDKGLSILDIENIRSMLISKYNLS